MRLGPVVLAALACATFAGRANAADIDNVRSLELGVRGTIAQHCAMGSIADMDFGDLNRPGLGAVARVALSCNVPFDMTIRARNGALTNVQSPNGQGPYSGALPYQIGVAMPVRRPSAAMVEQTFNSRDLTGGRTISSQGGIAVDGMALRVALGRPSGEAGLLAGDYAETIEITIAPS